LDPPVTHTREDRERGDRPLPLDAGKNRGKPPEFAAPSDEDLTGVAEAAGKDRGAWAHPPVASAWPGVARDHLPTVTGGAAAAAPALELAGGQRDRGRGASRAV
jgi:hypothetical protein